MTLNVIIIWISWCPVNVLCVKSFSTVGSSSCSVPQLKETVNSWLRETQIFDACQENDLVLWERPNSKAQFFTVPFFPLYPRSSWAEVGLRHCWQDSCLWKTQPWRQFMELEHNPVTPRRKKIPELVWLVSLLHFIIGFSKLLCTSAVSCLVRSCLVHVEGKGWCLGSVGTALWATGSWYLLLA